MIKTYLQFINENNQEPVEFGEILAALVKLPTSEIMDFRNEVSKIASTNESLNENFLSDAVSNLKHKFRRWFTDKLMNYLIGRKRDYYSKLVDKLSIFDLTDMSDVHKAYPSYKLTSMYLAGGMDAAKKGGKVGWRNIVEYELEFNHPGSKKNTPEIEIFLGEDGEDVKMVKPSYTVDGLMLDVFLENPKKCLELYNKPALLNPVRKEVDRNKIDFDKFLTDIKKTGSNQEDITKAFSFFTKTFAETIVPDDEFLINKVDAIFLGLNKVAGAGTYGELELLSFMEKPLFAALIEGYENVTGNFKLWNMPQLCKLARNEEEMIILIDSLYKDANK
jgi:hypothetical protein